MLYFLIFVLNIADYVLTVYLTGLYGIECEVNPIMRFALSMDGAFEFIKLIIVPALILYMWLEKLDNAALIVLGMFVVVVLLNATQAFGIYI